MTEALGRRVPNDWRHVERYALAERWPDAKNFTVETVLSLPGYVGVYDQGNEGACVGYAATWMMSILNRRRYLPEWLYREAQAADEWPGSGYDGTSIRAACDVLRTQGHARFRKGDRVYPEVVEGIKENRWATSVDEVRAALAVNVPVVLGCNWYTAFDTPYLLSGVKGGVEYWIAADSENTFIDVPSGKPTSWGFQNYRRELKRVIQPMTDIGTVRGGHAVCIYGASDKRQAVKIVNSWGDRYPQVWLPYAVLERLIREDGECAVVVDRNQEGEEAWT